MFQSAKLVQGERRAKRKKTFLRICFPSRSLIFKADIFCKPVMFFPSPLYFSLSAQKKFVTNLLTYITNFVTRVTKFLTSVTKFVIKILLYERKIYLADSENYLQANRQSARPIKKGLGKQSSRNRQKYHSNIILLSKIMFTFAL